MGKNDKKDNQPPSLFDNLDMFAPAKAVEKSGGEGTPDSEKTGEMKKLAKKHGGEDAPAPVKANVLASSKGLTGRGPMQELYDFNFRQYSAYVICDRAIPAVEDGLKPVQRRIMHSLWEKDDGRYTKVANIVGHA
ncbi:MAG: DNA topoisomerase, partial [Kiritimatiellae bacterium]|nr:DNA topoisomerase [Kiritimatiellia bacterium]